MVHYGWTRQTLPLDWRLAALTIGIGRVVLIKVHSSGAQLYDVQQSRHVLATSPDQSPAPEHSQAALNGSQSVGSGTAAAHPLLPSLGD